MRRCPAGPHALHLGVEMIAEAALTILILALAALLVCEFVSWLFERNTRGPG